jgi:putative methyltransferase (TIGR04325 family)
MTTSPGFNVWEGVYASFAEAGASGPGFDGAIWRKRSIEDARVSLARIRQGEPLDYSLTQRNALLPVIAAMLLTRQERVRILDFGGGPGFGLLVLMSALGDLRARIEYHVVDVACVCEEGRRLFSENDGPIFHTELPSTGGAQFDLVHTSSTMQYIEDWRSMSWRLAAYRAPWLIFEDVFVGAFRSYVTIQNYYGSRIPHWFLNDRDFVSTVESAGYKLLLHTPCHVKILERHGPLPMANLPEECRLSNKSNLLFRVNDETAA